MAFSRKLFLQKGSVIDVWQGSKYTSASIQHGYICPFIQPMCKTCCTLRSVKENKEGISFGRAPCMHMICYFTSDSFPIVKNYDFSQTKIQETF